MSGRFPAEYKNKKRPPMGGAERRADLPGTCSPDRKTPPQPCIVAKDAHRKTGDLAPERLNAPLQWRDRNGIRPFSPDKFVFRTLSVQNRIKLCLKTVNDYKTCANK